MIHWLRAHPLLGYFLLTFGISWGAILVVAASRGFDLSPLETLEGSGLAIAMLLGPSLSGLLLTALLDGRAGLRRIGASVLHWRVSPLWYGLALLTMPLTLLTVLLLFSTFVDPAYGPGFVWPLFAVGLIAGLFEEIGWTGFVTPRLLTAHAMGGAGLMLGLIWALWHLLVDFRYNAGSMGIVWILEFAIVYMATLTPYRILMTWVFARTRSLLLAILMHASFTGWLMVLFPQTSLQQSLLWQAVFASVLWLLVGVAMVVQKTSRKPIVQKQALESAV